MSTTVASLALLVAAITPAEPRTWSFRVMLDDREIGSHVFEIEAEGASRRVRSEARFRVSLLFIDAYRYAHTATEQWDGDCLVTIDARTEVNGRRRAVAGRRQADGFHVRGGARLEDDCVMSFAYWNPVLLRQARLLNAQTGVHEAVRVDSLGVDTVSVRGAPTGALRYALKAGALRIDVWYAERTREWVRLETSTKGRRLSYILE